MADSSRVFGAARPYKNHIVRGSGGVQAEVQDLRRDVDVAFYSFEQSGQLAEYHLDTVDPTVSNDETQGFSPFSRWINTSSPAREFVCLDASPGAADWKETTGTIPGGAVASVFGRTGNVISAYGDYSASQVLNDSLVAGATVADALNFLLLALPPAPTVTSVFGRTGSVAAFVGDYNSSQVTNLSSATGAYVTDALNALETDKVEITRTISAGVGLTGGGDLSANRTISAVPHVDGSVSVTGAGIRVGILASDTQHGTRGGGIMHALATTSVAGFMSPGDKGKLDTIPINAEANAVYSVFGRLGAIAAALGDYSASLITNTSTVPGVTVASALDYLLSATVGVPVSRQIISGNGLTGGGALTADLTLHVGPAVDGSITVSADSIQVGILATDAQHGNRGGGSQHALATAGFHGFMSAADKVKLDGLPLTAASETRNLAAGAGLTGGGDLTADRTFAVGAHADGSIAVQADTIQVGVLATDAQHGVRGGGTQHALATGSVSGFLSAADKTKLDGLPSAAAPTSRTLTAGTGLTGGGDLSADRTFNVTANVDGSIAVNANDIQIGVLATDAQHGSRGGGTQHAAATGAVAGFMSAADKTKLDLYPVSPVGSSLTWGSDNLAATTTTRYLHPWYEDGTAPTSPVQWRAPRAGTIRNMRVRHNSPAGNGNPIVYTLRIGGVASALTASLASTGSDASNVINSVAIAAGDLLDIAVTKVAGIGASPGGTILSVEYV